MTDLTDATRLAAGFPTPEADKWRAIAEKSLKGAPWEKIVGRIADGAPLQPLYREADEATAGDPMGLPGAAPFVRGTQATRDAELPWHIRQIFAHPDPDRTNKEILADLDRGVSSVELVIDPEGKRGVAVRSRADFDLALAGVHADLADVALDAGAHGLWAAELLLARVKGLAAAGTAFNIDPIGALMRDGAMGSDDVAAAVKFAIKTRETLPQATALRVDVRPVHEAGATEAQELAVALTAGIHYLRALTDAGLSAGEANKTILFTLAVGSDVLIEAAKLRALRLTWARVLEASGAAQADRAAKIHAVSSERMMSKRDAWSNILRTTAACFASALGGAEAITVLPLTQPLGLPTPFARRVARNTQLTLMEESRIGAVIDPAGGSWFVEHMTRTLADAAWTHMQGTEAIGGLIAGLTSGAAAQHIAEAAAKRQKAFATRRESVTGVTDFPLLEERTPETEAVDRKAILARRPTSEAPASRADVKGAALKPVRWSEPFEALRDKADAAAKRPSVFFANLGPLAEFSPRSNFARNLFAAGGVSAVEPEGVYDAQDVLLGAFKSSGTRVAVLCGSDKRYAAEAESAAQALKAAGAGYVIYAGKPADEAPLRAAGVDQFIFAGQNAIEALTALHGALGLK